MNVKQRIPESMVNAHIKMDYITVKNPTDIIQNYAYNLRDIRNEVKKIKESIQFVISMDAKEGYSMHPESIKKLIEILDGGNK